MWPFKRKSKPQRTVTRAGTWEVSQGTLGKDALFTRFDRQCNQTIGDPAYSHMLGVAVSLPHLPSKEEGAVLSRIEDAVKSALEADNQSLMVGVLTLPTLRQYIFYTSNPDAATEKVSSVTASISSHRVEARVEPDPDWQFYIQFAITRSGSLHTCIE